jgi:Na+:H+ antiporter, NhaA family
MATDIAFSIGVLTLLKDRVPRALVVFVTALAIFDDVGGILVIAFFYGHGLSAPWLLVAAATILVLAVMNRAQVMAGLAYAAAGAGVWYALHRGGIHVTIAGVVAGLAIPARSQRPPRDVLRDLASHVSDLDRKPPDEELDGAEILGIESKLEDLQAPLQRFVHLLHPLVAFVIMPLFALANSGVSLASADLSRLTAAVTLGTALGLLVGKPAGIYGLTMLAVKLRLAPPPRGSSGTKLFGVSIIAGIGFTVALFIAALAYPDEPVLLDQAKVGILLGSAAAGGIGLAFLRLTGAGR